jgi:vacuolar-type H+-ATPase subunit C/Vma6
MMDTIPHNADIIKWGFVSGRISALEERFLTREFFLNIISQEKIGDILPHLQETFLKDYLATSTVWTLWEDFGLLTDRCFYEMAISIRSECPTSLPADIYLIRGDYLNLRNALTGIATFPFPMGLFQQDKLQAIAYGELAELPLSLSEAGEWSISELGKVDPDILDIILDGAYLRHLLSLADKLNSSMIRTFISEKVLASIISILWRALNQDLQVKRYQQYLLPLGNFTSVINELAGMSNPESWPAAIGGTIGELLAEALEFRSDEKISGFQLKVVNYLTRLIHDGRLQTAGPERVFSFLTGLNVEMQNLKLVVTGRLNRIDKDLLKERLKDCYV